MNRREIVDRHIVVVPVVGKDIVTTQVRYARHVFEGSAKEMCKICEEAYLAGYMTRTEVWQCVYYLDIIRRNRDEPRRIPKRDPDDPRFVVNLGEGLLPFLFRNNTDEEDWFFLKYLPTRRRRLYRMKASGEGAERSRRESATRGVEDETNGWTKLHDY